jgi:hypothetical protein
LASPFTRNTILYSPQLYLSKEKLKEKSVIFFDVLHGSPEFGSLDDFKKTANERGFLIPERDHPGEGNSYSSPRND